ncbi:MAG: sugar kinase [Chloroflexota bacterium]|nr:sugar kinase [Chloroflexota bacterium]
MSAPSVPGDDDWRPYDLVTFGETMIRLTAEAGVRLEETGALRVTIGGTESNVAVALARLGRRTAWLSALPANPLGQRIAGELRRHRVDTTHILWTSGRVGVYFMEPGTAPRPTRVLYDRADSAIARIDPDALDVSIVKGAGILHLTGITPALSAGCRAACLRLADAARADGVPVSVDVNYRSRLWSPEQAAEGIQPLLDRATLVFCGAGDAGTIWGLTGDPAMVAQELLNRSSAHIVVVTVSERGSLALTRDGVRHDQPALPVETIDAVGAGDAFAAGFIHRWLDDPTGIPSALRCAAALAALKMTIYGDNAVITPDDLALFDASGPDIDR